MNERKSSMSISLTYVIYENVLIMLSTIHSERGYGNRSLDEAVRFYNVIRIHQSLGCRTPIEVPDVMTERNEIG